ncbi:MAG: transporter [Deltaproteobacteria bacterium]|nr:transporter [Deltaproteobacteria bacterium]
MKKSLYTLLFLILVITSGRNAYALGECGLSCCLAGAATSGITLAPNFGLSLIYEHAYMETIKNGTDDISPDEVISRNRQPMKSYSVPTEMRMQKVTLVGALPVTERFQLMASVPYVINDMNMRSKSAMGMTMDMRMETISGLGDVSLLGLYTLYTDAPVRPTERLTAGLGVKAPTGSTGEKTATGTLVHAMMQPGTGSWDPIFMVNYMRAYYPLVLQANLLYQWTTQGYNGYEFGDRFSYDLSARYQATNYVNLGVELNGIHAEKDVDHEGKYARAATSMIDNPEYTGLDSIFISPLVQVKIPNASGSAELKYQHPIYQDVNGYQQVVDWRVLASLGWSF